MVRLAVVCSPLPSTSAAARLVGALLPELAERAEITLVVPDPHQLPLAFERRYRLAPTADLGHLLDEGDVDVPLYVVGDGPEHLGQLRWLGERPGVVVLATHQLHGLVAAQTLDAGFERAYRERLAAIHPEAPIEEVMGALLQGERTRRDALQRWPMLGPWLREARAVAVVGAGAPFVAEQSGREVQEVPLCAAPRRWSRGTARRGLEIEGNPRVLAWAGPGARPVPGALVLVRDVEEHNPGRGDVEGLRWLDAETFDDLAWAAADGAVVATDGEGAVPQAVGEAAAHGVPVLTDHPGGAAFGERVSALDGALEGFLESLPRASTASSDPGGAAALLVGLADKAGATRELACSKAWPKVEAMVLAYKSKDYISPCIESLLDQDYPNLTITVIDNASGDGTGEFLREKYPSINVVIKEANLGFAGGNNLLFERSDADYFALLNHDAVARRDWARQLVEVAELDDRVGMVGAKMMMMRCPTIYNSTGIAMNEGGFAADRQIGESDRRTDLAPERVFGACGGAVLFRGRTIRELGGFDSTFFMYFEDVDLCWRMQIAGRTVYYNPAAVVVHDWHGDMAGDNDKEAEEKGYSARMERRRFLCERNRVQCVLKNYEFTNLRRIWKELKRFEKVRIGWCDNAIKSGNNVGYFEMVKRAIRRAYRWNKLRIVGVWARRRRTQALRQVPDSALAPLIGGGVGEPSNIGDLDAIRDRYSVDPVDRLVVGVNDAESLGSGWFPPENVADQDWNVRWTKGEAGFFLKPAAEARQLCIRLVPLPRPTTLTVVVNGVRAGTRPVAGREIEVLEFDLREPLPAGELVEGELRCGTFCPADLHGGEDRRELGLRVAEIWCQ